MVFKYCVIFKIKRWNNKKKLPINKYKNCSYNQYSNYLTYEKNYNKVREVDDNEAKCKFIIICDFLKDQIICGTAGNRLK